MRLLPMIYVVKHLSFYVSDINRVAMDSKSQKSIVEVKYHDYNPTKTELEADMRIDATPESLVKNVMQNVTVRRLKAQAE